MMNIYRVHIIIFYKYYELELIVFFQVIAMRVLKHLPKKNKQKYQ